MLIFLRRPLRHDRGNYKFLLRTGKFGYVTFWAHSVWGIFFVEMIVAKKESLNRGGWTALPRFLMRATMDSPNGSRMLNHMLSMPEDWLFSIRALTYHLAHVEGLLPVSSVKRAVAALRKQGILYHVDIRNRNGKTYSTDYVLSMVEHRTLLDTHLTPLLSQDDYDGIIARRRDSGSVGHGVPKGSGDNRPYLRRNQEHATVCAPYADVKAWMVFDPYKKRVSFEIPDTADFDYTITVNRSDGKVDIYNTSCRKSGGKLLPKVVTHEDKSSGFISGKYKHAPANRYTFSDTKDVGFHQIDQVSGDVGAEDGTSVVVHKHLPRSATPPKDAPMIQPKNKKNKTLLSVPKEKQSMGKNKTGGRKTSCLPTPRNPKPADDVVDSDQAFAKARERRKQRATRKASRGKLPTTDDTVRALTAEIRTTFGDVDILSPTQKDLYAMKAMIKRVGSGDTISHAIKFAAVYWNNLVTQKLSWMNKPRPPQHLTIAFFIYRIEYILDYMREIEDSPETPLTITKVVRKRNRPKINRDTGIQDPKFIDTLKSQGRYDPEGAEEPTAADVEFARLMKEHQEAHH